MQPPGSQAARGTPMGPNHPLAGRMGVIAFLNQNITIACMYGTFSVLMISVEKHLGVGPKDVAWGVPLVNLAMAIVAPLCGALATRYSLRLIMLVGSILGALGFVVLATTQSYPLYLIAYALGLGPAMATVGVVLPATLVTRWFVVNRGKALGLITVPLAIVCLPLTTTWLLQVHGLTITYWALAALSGVCVLANLFVIDWPPGAAVRTDGAVAAVTPVTPVAPVATASDFSIWTLLRSARFWMIAVASVASNCGTIILTANMVSIANSWGFSLAQGATLLMVQTIGGLGGTVLFGWVADRLGGLPTLALMLFDCAVLWLLFLLHLPFIATVAVMLLFGLHSSGSLPVNGTVISELVGRDNFSKAYGIFTLVNLPFSVACVPAAAAVFERTGSYNQALLAQVAFFAISIPLALFARGGTIGRQVPA
jgi:MFS family permease